LEGGREVNCGGGYRYGPSLLPSFFLPFTRHQHRHHYHPISERRWWSSRWNGFHRAAVPPPSAGCGWCRVAKRRRAWQRRPGIRATAICRRHGPFVCVALCVCVCAYVACPVAFLTKANQCVAENLKALVELDVSSYTLETLPLLPLAQRQFLRSHHIVNSGPARARVRHLWVRQPLRCPGPGSSPWKARWWRWRRQRGVRD
jgi:hypothetical protein